VVRQFVHSIEQVEEDAERWCAGLSEEELNARPMGLPSVAFHLRHMTGSLDRLLSYAEGRQLDEAQLVSMRSELDTHATTSGLSKEVRAAIAESKRRAQAFTPAQYNLERGVGRKLLPTTVGSLLVHCAEHTQRHLGQAITTAKLLVALQYRQR